MKTRYIFLTIAMLMLVIIVSPYTLSGENPKREFRGAWLHTVYQPQYAANSTERNKQYLRSQLDSLRLAGVNAVIFQVRPSADAFYKSNYEPWSRFLSGKAGVAPSPEWDPLEFMITEAHARGMELHAWLNPYRVTTSPNEVLPKNHIYHKHPERFVKYDRKLYFDPGQPENRKFICDVVLDIIERYDVDGIHVDDYFYPYPVAKLKFPDDVSYAKYGNGMSRNDWRRKNVDMLIEEIHDLISAHKPWVRFGVSPFGIWRNKSSDPRGSETSGLQNYDDLYADVLLWSRNGWVDYLLPQLYWELDHQKASSLKLADWWNANSNGRHIYIGQDVNRTMSANGIAPYTDRSQLRHKVELARQLPNVQGNCWWPGYSLTRNIKGVTDSLVISLQSTIALPPACPWIKSRQPGVVKGVVLKDGVLSWKHSPEQGETSDVVRYVIYRSANGNDADIEDASNIVAVINSSSFKVPADIPKGHYLIVTALDRVNNESPASMPVRIR